jgi:hypothetical protein
MRYGMRRADLPVYALHLSLVAQGGGVWQQQPRHNYDYSLLSLSPYERYAMTRYAYAMTRYAYAGL